MSSNIKSIQVFNGCCSSSALACGAAAVGAGGWSGSFVAGGGAGYFLLALRRGCFGCGSGGVVAGFFRLNLATISGNRIAKYASMNIQSSTTGENTLIPMLTSQFHQTFMPSEFSS